MITMLVPVFITSVVFFSIVTLVKVLSDNKVRHELISKGKIDENTKYLYQQKWDSHVPAALKWGIVLICIGLAFLVGQLVPDNTETITIICLFLFSGCGLIGYYFLAKRIKVDE